MVIKRILIYDYLKKYNKEITVEKLTVIFFEIGNFIQKIKKK